MRMARLDQWATVLAADVHDPLITPSNSLVAAQSGVEPLEPDWSTVRYAGDH